MHRHTSRPEHTVTPQTALGRVTLTSRTSIINVSHTRGAVSLSGLIHAHTKTCKECVLFSLGRLLCVSACLWTANTRVLLQAIRLEHCTACNTNAVCLYAFVRRSRLCSKIASYHTTHTICSSKLIMHGQSLEYPNNLLHLPKCAYTTDCF